MADTKPWVAEHLLELALAHTTDRSGNEGLSLELLQEHAQKNERLKTSLARLLSPRSIPPNYLKEDRRDREYVEERRRQRLDHVRSNEAALRENRATPVLLYQMGKKYFEFDFGNDGPKAIEKELRGDRSLTQAVLRGLRGAIDREDVPELEEILSLREKDHMHILGWPFLAGLAEVERTAPEDASRWDAGRICKAIAFYYCTPHGGYRPEWYRRLLAARPEIVADVQVQFAVTEFRGDREGIYKLWELAHDQAHSQVARHASLQLLRAFPTRCKLKHIDALDHLLQAALQHADRALGKPCSPKNENSCRDALLSDLRQLLPKGVDAQPEGHYAKDRRADIRVSCLDFQVPVEVKKNNHRDLWSACKNQLIKQYTTGPATSGYGIYLIFWFGKDCTKPPPRDTRPYSPQKLREQLKATLSEDEARKISVCVIDVSGDSLDYP